MSAIEVLSALAFSCNILMAKTGNSVPRPGTPPHCHEHSPDKSVASALKLLNLYALADTVPMTSARERLIYTFPYLYGLLFLCTTGTASPRLYCIGAWMYSADLVKRMVSCTTDHVFISWKKSTVIPSGPGADPVLAQSSFKF